MSDYALRLTVCINTKRLVGQVLPKSVLSDPNRSHAGDGFAVNGRGRGLEKRFCALTKLVRVWWGSWLAVISGDAFQKDFKL